MKIVHSIKNLNFSSGGPVLAIIDLSTKLVERGHSHGGIGGGASRELKYSSA